MKMAKRVSADHRKRKRQGDCCDQQNEDNAVGASLQEHYNSREQQQQRQQKTVADQCRLWTKLSCWKAVLLLCCCLCIIRGVDGASLASNSNIIIRPGSGYDRETTLLTIYIDPDSPDQAQIQTQLQGDVTRDVVSHGDLLEANLDSLTAIVTTLDGQTGPITDEITKKFVIKAGKGTITLQESSEMRLDERFFGQWLLNMETQETLKLLTVPIVIVPACQLPQERISAQLVDLQVPLWPQVPSDLLFLGKKLALESSLEATSPEFDCAKYTLEDLSDVEFVTDSDEILSPDSISISADKTTVRLAGPLGQPANGEALQQIKVTVIGTFGPKRTKAVIFSEITTLIDCVQTVTIEAQNLALLDARTKQVASDFDFFIDTLDKEGRKFLKPELHHPTRESMTASPSLEVQGAICLAEMPPSLQTDCTVFIVDEATQLELPVPSTTSGSTNLTHQTSDFFHLGPDIFNDGGVRSILIYTQCQLEGSKVLLPLVQESAAQRPIRALARTLYPQTSPLQEQSIVEGTTSKLRRLTTEDCIVDWITEIDSGATFFDIYMPSESEVECPGGTFSWTLEEKADGVNSGYEFWASNKVQFIVSTFYENSEYTKVKFSYSDSQGRTMAYQQYSVKTEKDVVWIYGNKRTTNEIELHSRYGDWQGTDIQAYSYSKSATTKTFATLNLAEETDLWNAHVLTVDTTGTIGWGVLLSSGQFLVLNDLPDYFEVDSFESGSSPQITIKADLPSEAVGTYKVHWLLRTAGTQINIATDGTQVKSYLGTLTVKESCTEDFVKVQETAVSRDVNLDTYHPLSLFGYSGEENRPFSIKYNLEDGNTFDTAIHYTNIDDAHPCLDTNTMKLAPSSVVVEPNGYVGGIDENGEIAWQSDFVWPDVLGGDTAVTIKITATVMPPATIFTGYLTLNGDECLQDLESVDSKFGKQIYYEYELLPTFNINAPLFQRADTAGLCASYTESIKVETLNTSGETVSTGYVSISAPLPIIFDQDVTLVTITIKADWSLRAQDSNREISLGLIRRDDFCQRDSVIEMVVVDGEERITKKMPAFEDASNWPFDYTELVKFYFIEEPEPFSESRESFDSLSFTGFDGGEEYTCEGTVTGFTMICQTWTQEFVLEPPEPAEYTLTYVRSNGVPTDITSIVTGECVYENAWNEVESPLFTLSLFHDIGVETALPTRIVADPEEGFAHTFYIARSDQRSAYSSTPEEGVWPSNYIVFNNNAEEIEFTVPEANQPKVTLLVGAEDPAFYYVKWVIETAEGTEEKEWYFQLTNSCATITLEDMTVHDGNLSRNIAVGDDFNHTLFTQWPLQYTESGAMYDLGVGYGPCPGTFSFSITTDMTQDVGVYNYDADTDQYTIEYLPDLNLGVMDTYITFDNVDGVVRPGSAAPAVTEGEDAVELRISFTVKLIQRPSIDLDGIVGTITERQFGPFNSWVHLGGDECTQDLQVLIPDTVESMSDLETVPIEITNEMLPATIEFGQLYERTDITKGHCYQRREKLQFNNVDSNFDSDPTVVVKKESVEETYNLVLLGMMGDKEDLYVKFATWWREKGVRNTTYTATTFMYFKINQTPICARGFTTMELTESEVGIFVEQGATDISSTFPLEATYVFHAEPTLMVPEVDLKVTDVNAIPAGESLDCSGALVNDLVSGDLEFFCDDWSQSLARVETIWSDHTIYNIDFEEMTAPSQLNCTYAKCSNLVDHSMNYNSIFWQEHPFGDVEGGNQAYGTQRLYITEGQVQIFVPYIVPYCEDHLPVMTIYANITDSHGIVLTLDGTESGLSVYDVEITHKPTGIYLDVTSENFDLMNYRLSLQIEAGVDFEPDFEFRNVTTFEILYLRPPCPITSQEMEDTILELGSTVYLATSYIKKAYMDFEVYRDAIRQFEETVPFHNFKCGSLVTVFSNQHNFVTFNDENGLMTLAPSIDTLTKVYYSVLVISYELNTGVAAYVEIESEVKLCLVQRLSFDTRSVATSYQVGTPSLDLALPALVQTPSCNYPIESYSLGDEVLSDLDPGLVLDVVTLNTELLPKVVIRTDEYELLGKRATYFVYAKIAEDYREDQGYTNVPIRVQVVFPSVDLKIDIALQDIPHITCSSADATWHVKLIVSPALGQVQISHDADNDRTGLFSFNAETLTISLNTKNRVSLMTGGEKCPVVDTVNFPIKLVSDKLGEASQLIPVKIIKLDLDLKSVGKGDSRSRSKNPLKITSSTFSVDGRLKFSFNKEFVAPKIYMYEADGLTLIANQTSTERQLQSVSATATVSEKRPGDYDEDGVIFYYEISDILSVEVDTSLAEDGLNQRIKNIALIGLTEQTMTVKVNFEEHNDITRNIQEPDELKVKFKIPELIVASSGFYETLEETNVPLIVPISPQMTTGELESILTAQAAAAVVGSAIAFWQLILFVFFGKTLNAMWTLINALQFFVYIATWQIDFPLSMQVIVLEIRRLTQGEYFDDLKLGVVTDIKEAVGIQAEEEGISGSNTGISRLGSTNIMDNLGVTMIVGSSVLFILIILILICRPYARNCSISVKNRERITALQYKVFFNPIIRFTFLQCLKLNITLLLPVVAVRGNLIQTILMASLFIAFNVLPFLYAKILHKYKHELTDNELNVKKFGILFVTLKVQKSVKGKESSGGKKVADGSETQQIEQSSQFVFDDIPMDQQDMKLPRPAEQEYYRFWLYQPVFMLRRTLFAVTTVALFDYPSMQMVIHQLLCLATLVYLSQTVYVSKLQKRIEIATEFMLLVCSTLLQQYLRVMQEETQLQLRSVFLGAISILLLINIFFMVKTSIDNYKAKKHQKYLMKLKEDAYKKALKEHREKLRQQEIIREKRKAAKKEMKRRKQEQIRLQRERIQAQHQALIEKEQAWQRKLKNDQEKYPLANIHDERVFDRPAEQRLPGATKTSTTKSRTVITTTAVPNDQQRRAARELGYQIQVVDVPYAQVQQATMTMIDTTVQNSSGDTSTQQHKETSQSNRQKMQQQMPSKILARAEQMQKEEDLMQARQEQERREALDTRTELEKEIERVSALKFTPLPQASTPSYNGSSTQQQQTTTKYEPHHSGWSSQKKAQPPLNRLEQAILDVENENKLYVRRQQREESRQRKDHSKSKTPLDTINEVRESQLLDGEHVVRNAELELQTAIRYRQDKSKTDRPTFQRRQR